MILTFSKKGLVKTSILIFSSLILLSSLLVLPSIFSAETGTGSTIMNATVVQAISLTPSTAVTRGILFGSSNAGINNIMAQNDTTRTGNMTEYNITLDSSSTSNVNFWHKAADMTRGAVTTDTIKINNVTVSSNQTYNGNNVNMTLSGTGTNSVSLTTTYDKIGEATAPCNNIAAGGNCHMAYWLDFPNVVAGAYNTTYNYCANSTLGTTAC